MTLVLPEKPARAASALRGAIPVPVLALLGLSLWVALGFAKGLAVWRTGAFFDTDDAMRLVQVRDWLAGQGWFDLTQHRMGPPEGVAMHWSRVVDVPLAGLILLAKPFVGADMAERLARLVFPAALALGFFATLAGLARRLLDGAGGLAATLLAAGALATMAQFEPGRIDHHGAQNLLLVPIADATLAALDPARWRRAALAGLLAALSLAISVENLPFLVAAAFVLAAGWIVRGGGAIRPLLAFALALAVGCEAAWFATVATAAPACDAFSVVHLLAAKAGGLACVGLALAGAWSRSATTRATLVIVAGGAALALVGWAYPACLGDPLGAVDALLRDLWLSNVSEARPLLSLVAIRPDLGAPVAIPLALGLAAILTAAHRARGPARGRWLGLSAFVAIGLAATLWQVRAASSTLPLAALGGAFVITALARRFGTEARPLLRIAPAVAALPFASLFWIAFWPAPQRPHAADSAACFAPQAYARLAALPAGTVLSSLDSGSYLLAHTPHRALAGAYHRNNSGNRAALDALLDPPETARAAVLASGADFVALCPAMGDVALYAERAPSGLAAAILKGTAPDWLVPVDGGAMWRTVPRPPPRADMNKASFAWSALARHSSLPGHHQRRPAMISRTAIALGLAGALAAGGLVAALQAQAQQGPERPRWERPGGPAERMGEPMRERRAPPPRARFSAEDRAAFLDARLAGMRAGLKLSADQDRLWPAVETAVRDMAKTTRELRERRMGQGRPENPVAGLRLMAEATTQRGQALTKLADASEPLWATLSEDQKRRLPMLSGRGGPRGEGRPGPRWRQGGNEEGGGWERRDFAGLGLSDDELFARPAMGDDPVPPPGVPGAPPAP